jgi:hypothetical protein
MSSKPKASPLSIRQRLGRKCFAAEKWLLWQGWLRHRYGKAGQQKVVFVLGCSKCGTSTLTSIFERDYRSHVFPEDSELTGAGEQRHTLRGFEELRAVFSRSQRPLIIAEPKLQSHLARTLLGEFPQSIVIWVYRNPKDAVCSNLARFSAQIASLLPIVNADHNNWRSQGVSAETRRLVTRFYSPTMSRADAAALLWYVRHMLILEYDLWREPRVLFCSYESIARNPARTVSRLYQAIGLPYPGDRAVKHIHSSGLGIGTDICLSPEVEVLCNTLLDRLQSHDFSTHQDVSPSPRPPSRTSEPVAAGDHQHLKTRETR